ncbi:MAG: hypothetical protein L0H53_08680 [Candidatus Nitrosocosmicus sp.]|nr:hypothetical protein [Candidatus Nitrosocosmicus sp.]MDN5866382.1 hypothetical protein [Candidatus Nitrosocosmicus sp.]
MLSKLKPNSMMNVESLMRISCSIKRKISQVCLLEVQDKEAVIKHNEKLAITSEWTTEVKTTV